METVTVLFNWGGSRVLNKRSLSLEICFELEATMPQLLTSIEQCHFSKWSEMTNCLNISRRSTVELETKICRESSG